MNFGRNDILCRKQGGENSCDETNEIEDTYQMITECLLSERITDQTEGMKILLSFMVKGENVSRFFPIVVQVITSENEELRHLAYVYLSHHTESDPDSMLMSVNTFQRSLTDKEPAIRALSLKLLSSIRSTEIIEIVLNAIQISASDESPYVRKEAALSLVKIFEASPHLRDSIIPLVQKLLKDQSIITISGALFAVSRISPDCDALIHPIYRTLCKILTKLDPWGQSTALHILTRYVRRNFIITPSKHNFFIENEENFGLNDPDLDLLFHNARPLLNSITPSVTFAACSLFFYCTNSSMHTIIVKPLIRLIYGDMSTTFSALHAISSFIADNPEPFIPHIRHFFLSNEDIIPIKKMKLTILSQLVRKSNLEVIIREMSQHIYDDNNDISMVAINALGMIATTHGENESLCMKIIVHLLHSKSERVLSQTIKMLCKLFRHSFRNTTSENKSFIGEDEAKKIIEEMALIFNKIINIDTKVALVSLINDKCDIIPHHSHEVLRQLALTFSNQNILVKYQAVLLAAKLYSNKQLIIEDLTRYVLTLGFYDNNIDLRDWSRLLHSLIAAPTQNEEILSYRKLATKFMFPEKPDVVWEERIIKASEVEAGSFSSIFGFTKTHSSQVVAWCDPLKQPKSSLRDESSLGWVDDQGDIDSDLELFFEATKNELDSSDIVIIDQHENEDITSQIETVNSDDINSYFD
ncbi:Adaptin N terminal region family protein [Tritrichomonas foetus]|uniref:Adaptin N terminal region family protein n=1 Tax=Tritrichomonas foetus TaxID=1144522 RepID=A0A1J4KP78_9EUKA|nr:Adaptin N terminal region family protein [Tritrichomonas foetus]|eukprot:OHT12906.1 Adaptin N terminal region family protein [Tritrichomonas foetus]